MVKLQKRFAYRYKEKDHFKHMITVPEKEITKLGWRQDSELEIISKDDKLIIKRKGK